jgi:hypothetical protein
VAGRLSGLEIRTDLSIGRLPPGKRQVHVGFLLRIATADIPFQKSNQEGRA